VGVGFGAHPLARTEPGLVEGRKPLDAPVGRIYVVGWGGAIVVEVDVDAGGQTAGQDDCVGWRSSVQGVVVEVLGAAGQAASGESDQAAFEESDHWGRAWVRVVAERRRETRVRPLIFVVVWVEIVGGGFSVSEEWLRKAEGYFGVAVELCCQRLYAVFSLWNNVWNILLFFQKKYVRTEMLVLHIHSCRSVLLSL
jgi:hypothetical protein